MNKIKKGTAILLAMMMLFSIFALTGCGGGEEEGQEAPLTDWAYIEDKGELVVGLDDAFAPMGFRDEGDNLVGFDIDMANAVGEILGVAITFMPIDWDSKELELESKNIDCIWNGMSVTDERKERMTLTNMYLNNCIVVMSMSSDVNVIAEEDIANYNIGTQVDSSALKVMQESALWDTYKDNVSEFKTFDEAIMALQGGRVDVIVVDQVLGEYKNSKMEEKMFACDFNFGDDFYAIGCRKGEVELAGKLNDSIQTLIDNGKAAEISEKWFGKDIVMLKGYDE